MAAAKQNLRLVAAATAVGVAGTVGIVSSYTGSAGPHLAIAGLLLCGLLPASIVAVRFTSRSAYVILGMNAALLALIALTGAIAFPIWAASWGAIGLGARHVEARMAEA